MRFIYLCDLCGTEREIAMDGKKNDQKYCQINTEKIGPNNC